MRAIAVDNTRWSDHELAAIAAFAYEAADGSMFANVTEVKVNAVMDMTVKKAEGLAQPVGDDDEYLIIQGGKAYVQPAGFMPVQEIESVYALSKVFPIGKLYLGNEGVTLDVVRLRPN